MPRPAIQILVCVNDRGADSSRPCCAARDGLAVYHRLKDLVRERGLKDEVLVTRTGCLKHCSRGTTVAAWPENRWYGFVTPADAGAILDCEVDGAPVPDALRMPEGPWE